MGLWRRRRELGVYYGEWAVYLLQKRSVVLELSFSV